MTDMTEHFPHEPVPEAAEPTQVATEQEEFQEAPQEISNISIQDNLHEDHIVIPSTPEVIALFNRCVRDRLNDPRFPEESLTDVGFRMVAPFIAEHL